MFRGSIVALVTPLLNDQVDIDSLRELVEFHIQSGTHGIVVAGTTGEVGTLTAAEKLLVIKTVVEQAKERIPVIAGTAANATNTTIELTRQAMNYGVDGVLIMTPAYIKPTQEGLFQHYSEIAKAAAIPIILYNVPSRTACDLLPETVVRLSHISNIVGIKEASGDISRLQEISQQCGDMIKIYSGDDPNAAKWLLAGAKGVISVTANVAPKLMAKLCDAAVDNEQSVCLEINQQLMPLHQLMFVESNPIPAKWALARMGLISGELRLPMTQLSMQHHQQLENVLISLNLL
ncbi:MAG: 4-hydroxy-tetrahydrodipicolinate synthase [Legionella sp.]